MTWLGDAVREWQLRKELERGYSDQARIGQDLQRLVAREDLAAERAWAEMRADGVPVADRYAEAPAATEPEPEIG
jgi:hypothetical protein